MTHDDAKEVFASVACALVMCGGMWLFTVSLFCG